MDYFQPLLADVSVTGRLSDMGKRSGSTSRKSTPSIGGVCKPTTRKLEGWGDSAQWILIARLVGRIQYLEKVNPFSLL